MCKDITLLSHDGIHWSHDCHMTGFANHMTFLDIYVEERSSVAIDDGNGSRGAVCASSFSCLSCLGGKS